MNEDAPQLHFSFDVFHFKFFYALNLTWIICLDFSPDNCPKMSHISHLSQSALSLKHSTHLYEQDLKLTLFNIGIFSLIYVDFSTIFGNRLIKINYYSIRVFSMGETLFLTKVYDYSSPAAPC